MQGETKERAFLGNMDEELRNNSDAFLPDAVSKSNSELRNALVIAIMLIPMP